MQSDWVKMRTDLYRDPKVCAIADSLLNPEGDLARHVNQFCQCDMAVTRNVMRNVTVGALVSVWGVTRHTGKRERNDLVVRGVSVSVVDDIADLPGFGEAMQGVGWLVSTDDGIVFPNYFETYNVDPHKEQKQKNAERQRRYRENKKEKRNVTVTSFRNAREEKRREEKSIGGKPPITPSAPEKFVRPTVEEVAAYCRERGNKVDAEQWIAHYESNGWKVGRNPMKDWKAAVRTWEKNDLGGTNGRKTQPAAHTGSGHVYQGD